MNKIIILNCIILITSACNTSTHQNTNTTATFTLTATPTTMFPLPTPSSDKEAIITESPQPPTATTLPPPTPTASATLGPYKYTIQQGDTLGYIVQQFGYSDLSTIPGSIISQTTQLNGLLSADLLPPPGTTILIPRQTTTPGPQNEATSLALNITNTAMSSNPTPSEDTPLTQYFVQEGDTLVSISQDYETTLRMLALLNPDLDIFSCNLEIPSGGPNCNVPLKVGQAINVPAPTPTPTLSPTPSGHETATLQPTYTTPMLISPPNGANAPPGVFSLQWSSVGILTHNEFYLVQIIDTSRNISVFQQTTKDTSIQLPENLIPTDGQPHTYTWGVWITKVSTQGVYEVISNATEQRTFTWQSR
jgi:LysM repeat protein